MRGWSRAGSVAQDGREMQRSKRMMSASLLVHIATTTIVAATEIRRSDDIQISVSGSFSRCDHVHSCISLPCFNILARRH